MSGLSPQQWSFVIILLVAFGVLLTERIRNDLVAILIVLALAITGVLSPEEALAGFGSEPAIVVVSIFVLSGAMEQTRLADWIGRWIGRMAGTTYHRMIAVIMPMVALFSSVTHHVTTTAVMLPVTLALARERDIAPSKLLMPLSFAASLGTTITIIGAPAFLVASETLQEAGRPALGVFSIAPIGLALSLAGTLFVLLTARFLLPTRQSRGDIVNRFQVDAYFTELTILPESQMIGKTLVELKTSGQFHFTVVGWIRGGQRLSAPLPRHQVQPGDTLMVQAAPDDLAAFRQEPGVKLQAVEKFGGGLPTLPGEGGEESELVQAIIAPNADIVGRTLRDLDFRRRYGPIVLGLWRQSGFVQEELSQVRLEGGDVLVLQGDDEALSRVERDPAFLMLVPFHGETRSQRKAPLVAAILIATVLVSALGLLSLEIATLAGAAAVVLTKCLTPRQAYRSIDSRIYIFIAGAIPLGHAMQKTGVSTMMASWLQQAIGAWPQYMILLAIFVVVGVITQFMSDAATTALFAPMALALAVALGHPPEPYVVTVAMAAVATFLTPIGHHGNLLIYGPGGYQFRDFVLAGAPLSALVGVIVVTVANLLWPS